MSSLFKHNNDQDWFTIFYYLIYLFSKNNVIELANSTPKKLILKKVLTSYDM